MLKPAVQGLRSSVDRVMSQREQYIDKFCRFLDKDIVALRKELKGLKNEAQVLLYVHVLITQKIQVGISSNFLQSIRTSICIRKFNKNFL